ncbi:metal ABC transporter ATP-binding protein [Nesterenkonia flava]|uniref:Metal ABC transporter ATP-binding protein n=1 Tax=Nesterenkonia flava TaxID=469799 RepID=A0ABU1FTV4_9MICC|nr:metal ABC transporter ATP-binding protein [Nesterenkonia flava]MDR5711667.1 metal ABC transporter ATP-binding protein [Nesterenkonia flava]
MPEPVIRLRSAEVSFGPRTLWKDLDLDISEGEFIAVLGPNGAGKSTFLKVLLGLQRLTAGRAEILGRPVSRGSSRVGYIPQQHALPPETPLRARDLVALGIEGHRFGIPFRSARTRAVVQDLLERVGASRYADQPVGVLSGGEQQRLRAAQALAGSPAALLCDEPLHSLDLHHQRAIADLIKDQASEHGSAVVFVTHEINPVIEHVDRVLYFARGQYRIGSVEDVMRTEVLSELYDSPVEVIRHKGRLLVMGDHIEAGHEHDASTGHGLPYGVGEMAR